MATKLATIVVQGFAISNSFECARASKVDIMLVEMWRWHAIAVGYQHLAVQRGEELPSFTPMTQMPLGR